MCSVSRDIHLCHVFTLSLYPDGSTKTRDLGYFLVGIDLRLHDGVTEILCGLKSRSDDHIKSHGHGLSVIRVVGGLIRNSGFPVLILK